MANTPINARYQVGAAVEQHRLINRLRGLDTAEADALAEILTTCTSDAPCNSGACPVCGGDFQLRAVELAKQEIGIPARAVRRRMHGLTLVPSIGCVAPDALSAAVCRRVRAAVAAALVECDLPPNLFAIDISFNEDALGIIPSHWCVHGHGAGLNWLMREQVEALKGLFPKTQLVSTPVNHQQLDHDEKALLYPYKPARIRRVSDIVPAAPNGGRASHRDTKRRSLRPWQSATLALVEHEVGYRGRLIGHKINADALEELVGATDGP